jgi:site-specific recombinase XerD
MDSYCGPVAARDALIFKLLYSSGLKVNEITGLRVRDIELSTASMRLDERAVPIYPDLVDQVRSYLNGARKDLLGSKRSKFAFPANNGARLSRSSVFRNIQRIGRAADLEISPSQLRKSFAAIAFGQGIPVNQLQGVLGHRSLYTTARLVGSRSLEKPFPFASKHPRNKS